MVQILLLIASHFSKNAAPVRLTPDREKYLLVGNPLQKMRCRSHERVFGVTVSDRFFMISNYKIFK
jgi:hypothetical protein